MEQGLLGKLKRVKILDLLAIFRLLAAIIPALLLRAKRKDIWLLCDNGKEAGDNAFFLFEYIRKEHPECDAVFAISKKSRDFGKVKATGPVVEFGSLKHWIYYLAADKNISSQKLGKPNAAICYVLEVYGIFKNKRAFLQHGIITADLTFLHFEHTKMSLFVTSTKKEWKYVERVYGYPEGINRELGLCRFDKLHDAVTDTRKLLIMPTWRMYIRNEMKGAGSLSEFKKTDYYHFWMEIVGDKEFLKWAKENGIEVVFCPHREMESFLEGFELDKELISFRSVKYTPIQPLLMESGYLLTDYSSVAMDFAYMKKPLCYYHFDEEKFRSSHHPIGDFSFEEEGFGPVCADPQAVKECIKRAFDKEKGFLNEEKYLVRHGKYFDLYDRENCRRNYEAVRDMIRYDKY